jgi:cytochrome b561
MMKISESADLAGVRSNAAERYDQTSVMFHWITVVLIIVQFATIWAREWLGHHSSFGPLLLSLHRTTGVLTLTIVVGRLTWRRYFAYVPALPANMPTIQQFVAKANEYCLYILLVAMPITGLARVLLRGQPFDLLIWRVPALIEPHPSIRALFAEAHEAGATALMALIALHVGAALYHQLVLRDDVPQRMLLRNFSRRRRMPSSEGNSGNKTDPTRVSVLSGLESKGT